MTDYHLTMTKEEDKLARLRYAGQCALRHIIITKDSSGHIFAILKCDGCKDRMFCRKTVRVVENELTLGV